uniref:Flap endonuclease GEN-like 1 n=1 Tax=Nelumbo nucifera TaxID=4432 RepID=A0A822ZT15_NELNU|nr:TPA_asm: hypothetical protein HUJ06_017964 [Nelumbo nucifera]
MQEPFECYNISDIEAGLGLKRKHLIAISLLVGNDHDLNGVPGIGVDTALRFVQMFSEDEVLNRLQEVGNGETLLFQGGIESVGCIPNSVENSIKTKSLHCSCCGHPGTKRGHLKVACNYCSVNSNENCIQKMVGFKCECSSCDSDRKSKEQKKHENWQIKVCQKIAMEQSFPNNEIIELYLSHNHGNLFENGPLLWENPNIETLVDFLCYHQQWDPSYIRQKMLPMLSTIFLREMASNPTRDALLYGQYEFNSIQRVKVRCGHPFYVVKWKKAAHDMGSAMHMIPTKQVDLQQGESDVVAESSDLLDEPDVPQILVIDECWFLLTDENIELVRAAFPRKVEAFLKEKEMKELKSRRKKSASSFVGTQRSESPKSSGIQLSITEFYRSTKLPDQAKQAGDSTENSEKQSEGISKARRKGSSPNLSKSVRRRLLFD